MGREKTVIICRCNDVTLDDVLIAINEGIDDFELLRKYLKIGFGPCQGRSCMMIAARIFVKEKSLSIEDVLRNYRIRPPIIPVSSKYFIHGDDS